MPITTGVLIVVSSWVSQLIQCILWNIVVVVVVVVVWHPMESVWALDVLFANNYRGSHCLFFMGKSTHTVYFMEYGNCHCCCCCFFVFFVVIVVVVVVWHPVEPIFCHFSAILRQSS